MTDAGAGGAVRQAVILAGGVGSRLGALTKDTPKPMLNVAGRPFLVWLVDEVRRQGFNRIVVCAGFMAAKLERELRLRAAGVTLVAEPRPLGTAGALRFALDRLEPRFLLLNGDTLFDIDLQRLVQAAAPQGALATLALRSLPDAARYGAVRLEGGRVTRFEEKTGRHGEGQISGGVAVIDRDLIAGLAEGVEQSLERDVYPAAAVAGLLAGVVFEGDFIDIGTPDDYRRAQTIVPRVLGRRGRSPS